MRSLREAVVLVLVASGCHERMCPGGPAYPIDEEQCNARFGPVITVADASVVDATAIDVSAPIDAATPTDAERAPDVRPRVSRPKTPPAACTASTCAGVGQCDAWFEGFVWTGAACAHFSTAGCSPGNCQFFATLDECNEAHAHCHVAPPECPHSQPPNASTCHAGGPSACTYSSAGTTTICTCRNDHWACELLPH